MYRLYPNAVADDFEATIRIFTADEGGRQTATFNGIRWDFSYALDDRADNLYGIWPDFFAPSGASLPSDRPLPVGMALQARMTVWNDDLRIQVHRHRIHPGVAFYCREGARRVALGQVTRITGLHNERPQRA